MEAKKSLGQHFLRDEGVLVKIKRAVEGAKRIVEIGGGRGALTEHLLKLGVPVTVVEIDDNLCLYLRDRFKGHNIEIVQEDAASFSMRYNSSVVGNLPYNVSKRIIRNMILQKEKVEKMIFMVQKEVADSIVAKPSTKEYTKFSVFVQMFCDVRRLFNVKKGAFFPQPKVESSVVELSPYRINALNRDIDKGFFDFLDILFAHPRKTVKNNLKGVIDNNKKGNNELMQKRPEELSIEEIYDIYSGWLNE